MFMKQYLSVLRIVAMWKPQGEARPYGGNHRLCPMAPICFAVLNDNDPAAHLGITLGVEQMKVCDLDLWWSHQQWHN